MQNQPSLDIGILRYGFLFKPLPMNVILGDQLAYGAPYETHLEEEKKHANGYLVYLKHRRGRGIRIFYSKENSPQLQIHLLFPADEEEIKEAFALAKRIHDASFCRMVVNGERVSPKDFESLETAYQQFNLQVLHTMASNTLNQENARMILSCVKHTLVISQHEAEGFWAGTNTKNFGDWMDRLQRTDAVIAKLDILQHKNDENRHLGVYVIYSDEETLLPKVPVLPAGLFDFEKGKPKIQVERWSVCLREKKTDRTFAMLEFSDFLNRLSEEQKAYYDGGRILIKAMNPDTMAAFPQREAKGDAS